MSECCSSGRKKKGVGDGSVLSPWEPKIWCNRCLPSCCALACLAYLSCYPPSLPRSLSPWCQTPAHRPWWEPGLGGIWAVLPCCLFLSLTSTRETLQFRQRTVSIHHDVPRAVDGGDNWVLYVTGGPSGTGSWCRCCMTDGPMKSFLIKCWSSLTTSLCLLVSLSSSSAQFLTFSLLSLFDCPVFFLFLTCLLSYSFFSLLSWDSDRKVALELCVWSWVELICWDRHQWEKIVYPSFNL